MRLGRRLGRLLTDFNGQDGFNLRPKSVPSCSQNGIQIDSKIDRNIDGFGNRFLNGLSSTLGGEIKASWNENGIQIRSYLENAVKQKVLLNQYNFSDFVGSGVTSWEPKSIQIRSKFEVQDGVPLGIDF